MVVVIGGGATGLGVAWDLTLRGIPVTVVESREIGSGTSGRFHGLLHSGARYAVADPVSALQCREENARLRHVAASAIEPVGGYFVAVDDAGESYVPAWLKGARDSGIPVQEVSLEHVRGRLPGVATNARRAFAVPDAVLEGFNLLQLLSANITQRGGEILTQSAVVGVHNVNGRVSGVTVRGSGYDRFIPCDAVVSAAGPWAGEVARLFEDSVPMALSSGLMIIYANRMVPHVVNRLAPPGDGDIIVPHGNTVILGTTEVPQDGAESASPTRQEAQYLQSLGAKLFPDIAHWRALRAFVGVRPLVEIPGVVAHTRLSRDFAVVDHGDRAGLHGAFSVVGGKWTTFRLMAERTADSVAAFLGVGTPSTSAEVVLDARNVPARRSTGPVACECEQVAAAELERQWEEPLDNWRTRTWWAMGPCQGTVCGHRGLAVRIPRDGVSKVFSDLKDFRTERARGVRPVTWGDNARQWALNQAITGQTLAEGAVGKFGD